jgi:hypothetical protein
MVVNEVLIAFEACLDLDEVASKEILLRYHFPR